MKPATRHLISRLAGFAEQYASDSALNAGGRDLITEARVLIGDAPKPRTHADTLTIAYVAIGAKQALLTDGLRTEPRYDSDDWGGELRFIEAVTQHAMMLDQLADPIDAVGGLDGVFCYEVAEEFGTEYANALLDGAANTAPITIATRLIKAISRNAP